MVEENPDNFQNQLKSLREKAKRREEEKELEALKKSFEPKAPPSKLEMLRKKDAEARKEEEERELGRKHGFLGKVDRKVGRVREVGSDLFSWWGKKLGFLLICGIVIFVLIWGYNLANTPKGKMFLAEAGVKVREGLDYPVVWFRNNVLNPAYASGDVWKTEQTTIEKSGIILKELKPVSKRVPIGAPLDLSFVYEAKNVKIDKTPLTPSCNIEGKKGKDKKFEILPKEPVIENDQELPFIQCRLQDTSNLGDKEVTVKGSLSFPYVTRSALRVYFIRRSTYNAKVKEPSNFWNVYNIKERLPIGANYDGQPVEVQIGAKTDNQQPVIVDDESQSVSNIVGVNLVNRWDGNVTQLTSFELSLPAGVEIDTSSSPLSLACPFELEDSTEEYNRYSVSKGYLDSVSKLEPLRKMGDITRFLCWVKTDPDKLMEGVEQLNKLYSVQVQYVYQTKERSAVIDIQGANVD